MEENSKLTTDYEEIAASEQHASCKPIEETDGLPTITPGCEELLVAAEETLWKLLQHKDTRIVLDTCKFIITNAGAAHSWGSKLKRLEKEEKKIDPQKALQNLFGETAPQKTKKTE